MGRAVFEITGLARSTIGQGQRDLPKGRVGREGDGRRHLSSRDER